MNNLIAHNLFIQEKKSLIDIIRKFQQTYGIQHINYCQCGAFTFEFNDEQSVSVKANNAPQFFTFISQDEFYTLTQKLVPNYCYCNHCVNHWGLDLCRCGSGNPADECSEGTEMCGYPSQRLEDYL